MITPRYAAERGISRFDWLDSRHSFSFAGYHDPAHMGVSVLRVLNDDRVAPGRGFGKHAHRDMEIITYVLAGALQHEDSLGNGSIIRPGEVQRMSAGTGIVHSEYNASASEPVHFLQIWIVPAQSGTVPAYAQRAFASAELQGRLRRVVSGGADDGAVHIDQDADMYVARLAGGEAVQHWPRSGRHIYVFVARGDINVNGLALVEGDAVAARAESLLTLQAVKDGEVLLFDLP